MAGETTGGDTGTTGGESGTQDAAPVIDYGEILAQQQHELARTGKTVESLRGELGKSHETMDRVRKAFAGEKEEQLSPYQARMREFDDLDTYLQQEARTSEKNGGTGLPITTKIGKQLVSYAKESEARAEKLEQELTQIKDAIKRQQNPAFQGLERAAFIMEGMVDDGLEQMYGKDQQSRQIRAAQFNAVTARINEEIKDLMKNDPEALLKVQRNPKIMRNMVNHFMSEMLPPKVRTMLEDQRIKDEPMAPQQLFQAFAEAREAYEDAQSKGDKRSAQQYSNLMTDLRQDILAQQISGKRGGTVDKPSLNSLFAGVMGGR